MPVSGGQLADLGGLQLVVQLLEVDPFGIGQGQERPARAADWDASELAPVARGASGVVMGVPITLSEVAVGDFVAHDVEAVIVPEGLGISLLGQSFLSHVENVAISGDKLTLSD